VTEAGTGYHIRANNPPMDKILCRVSSGQVYFFDRDQRIEIGINVAELVRISMMQE